MAAASYTALVQIESGKCDVQQTSAKLYVCPQYICEPKKQQVTQGPVRRRRTKLENAITMVIIESLLVSGKLPWLAGMEVDLDQGPRGAPLVGHLVAQVEAHQLLVARVEAETRRQRRVHLPQPHQSILPSYRSISSYISKPHYPILLSSPPPLRNNGPILWV